MEVELTAEAVAQLAKLPSPIVGRMDAVVERLKDWPNVSGAKPLKQSLKGNFRIRTGDYRIVFRLEGGRIIVWRIADRRDAYEE
ncbi:MAG TPA: type II toxin-antitoxin system RelE/ParE family toxin [Tepidisphaeraceae bacterium]|jgi:mRNA-degrading endonuclease RelE of RelBE toxin-antitoxin system|nr:type II toxin-antitoxin system RelE/ParE family toxin [Tepidisphaeraceae bacterium]